jgi:hypothetical protein
MKQSPIHLAVFTLKFTFSHSTAPREWNVPIGDVCDNLKRFLNTFVGNFSTLRQGVVVRVSVKPENVK